MSRTPFLIATALCCFLSRCHAAGCWILDCKCQKHSVNFRSKPYATCRFCHHGYVNPYGERLNYSSKYRMVKSLTEDGETERFTLRVYSHETKLLGTANEVHLNPWGDDERISALEVLSRGHGINWENTFLVFITWDDDCRNGKPKLTQALCRLDESNVRRFYDTGKLWKSLLDGFDKLNPGSRTSAGKPKRVGRRPRSTMSSSPPVPNPTGSNGSGTPRTGRSRVTATSTAATSSSNLATPDKEIRRATATRHPHQGHNCATDPVYKDYKCPLYGFPCTEETPIF